MRARAEAAVRAYSQPLVYDHSTCGGSGQRAVPTLDARGYQDGTKLIPCEDCKRTGRLIARSAIAARLSFWSTAARPGAERKIQEEAEATQREPATESRTIVMPVESIDLIGKNCAIVVYRRPDRTLTDPDRWVEVSGRWCLYAGEAIDGPWPVVPEAAPAAMSEPVSDAIRAALAKVVAEIVSTRTETGVLVVELDPGAAPDAQQAWLRESTIPVSRALFGLSTAPAAVRVVVLGKYRDKFGQVCRRAAHSAEIARADFSRIKFENLTPDEALALWTWKDSTYDDVAPWGGKAASDDAAPDAVPDTDR